MSVYHFRKESKTQIGGVEEENQEEGYGEDWQGSDEEEIGYLMLSFQ